MAKEAYIRLSTSNMRLVFLCLLIIALSKSYGNTIFVTSSSDNGVGSLRNAINIASSNDTIRFSNSFINGQNDTINLDSSLIITKPIVIIGIISPNDTLFVSGQNSSRILHYNINTIYSGNCVLDSLSIIEGNTNSFGGGIYFENGDTLILKNSLFTLSDGEHGGAIASFSNLKLELCTFFNNNAAWGGALYFSAPYCSLTIEDCSFLHNSSNINGGAISVIYSDHCDFNFYGNDFFNNESSGSGGAISLRFISNSTVQLVGNSFELNHAVDDAGAILFDNSSYLTTLLESTSFINNSSGYGGGAIFYTCGYAQMDIVNCQFIENSAVQSGGAIMNGTTHYFTLNISQSLFENNSAGNSGGAINYQNFCTSQNDITVVETQFLGNSANGGGAIRYNPNLGSLIVESCLFKDNFAVYNNGGAISSIRQVTVTNSEFFNNSTDGNGGAISSRFLNINESTLRGNSAFQGGAISTEMVTGMNTCNILVTNCQIDSNTSTSHGGALFFNWSSNSYVEANLEIIGSTLCGNISSGSGGAIYSYANTVSFSSNMPFVTTTIRQSTISGNSSQDGGGIYSKAFNSYTVTTNSTVNIINSTIVYNGVASGTGGVSSQGTNSSINVSSSIVAYNEMSNFSNNGINTITSQGYNIFEEAVLLGSILTDTLGNDSSVVDLGNLVDNGGFGLTHMPGPLSPAINNGNYGSTVQPQNHPIVDDIRDIGSAEYYCITEFFDTAFVCYGDSYSLQNGSVIDTVIADTVFSYSIISPYSCDTMVHLTIQILPVYTTYDTVTICMGSNFVFPDGSIESSIMSSLTHVSSITGIAGCDSLINTYLQVSPNFLIQDTVILCQGDDYVFADGSTQFSVTTPVTHVSSFITQNGCDSLIETHLDVKPLFFMLDTVEICSGSDYIFPDGSLELAVVVPITHTSHLNTINGCDSLIETHLEVKPFFFILDTVEICNGSDYIFPDGSLELAVVVPITHTSHLYTIHGCDSLIETHLEVIEVNTSILSAGEQLIAQSGIASYQWVDCENNFAEISGATNQSYAPGASGSYAVEVTENGCTDTSVCVVLDFSGIGELENTLITVYPSPSSNGKFIVAYSGAIKHIMLVDQSGRIVSIMFDVESGEVDASGLASGSYILQIVTDTAVLSKTVVIL
jgi:predicted outer membrane repeat protein